MISKCAAIAAVAILNFGGPYSLAQGASQRRGGRGIPNATAEQNAAVSRMNDDLASQTQRLASARTELVAAALAQPRRDAAIGASVDAVRAAELELARARADAFAKL